jgi:hypothetical protein
LLDIGHANNVALAREKCRCHREVARLGETAAEVLDMLVDPEDLVHDQHSGKRTARAWHRAVTRDLAPFDWNFDLTRDQALAVGRNRFGRNGKRGKCEACRKTSDDERTPREMPRRVRITAAWSV